MAGAPPGLPIAKATATGLSDSKANSRIAVILLEYLGDIDRGEKLTRRNITLNRIMPVAWRVRMIAAAYKSLERHGMTGEKAVLEALRSRRVHVCSM